MQINQSETITVKRSQINFAPYNPRVDDPEIVEILKRNFKRVGFFGGIVWNALSGNLVSGHKRVQATDIIYRYNGTPETDYDIKVERVELDHRTEVEQNIFMNSQSAMGSFNYMLLADLLPEIDFKNAGLKESDIEMIELEVPAFDFGESQKIFESIQKAVEPVIDKRNIEKEERKAEREAVKTAEKALIPEKTIEERKQEQKEDKQQLKEESRLENTVKTYVILSFSSTANKMAFMQRFDFDVTQEFIKGESFSDMIERVK